MQESALVADVYELTEKKKLENTLTILACRRLSEVLFSTLHSIKYFCILLIINFWMCNLEIAFLWLLPPLYPLPIGSCIFFLGGCRFFEINTFNRKISTKVSWGNMKCVCLLFYIYTILVCICSYLAVKKDCTPDEFDYWSFLRSNWDVRNSWKIIIFSSILFKH